MPMLINVNFTCNGLSPWPAITFIILAINNLVFAYYKFSDKIADLF